MITVGGGGGGGRGARGGLGLPRPRRGAQRRGGGGRVGRAEDRRAGDQRGGAVLGERGREVRLHAAVHRDVHRPVAEQRADLADLPVRARQERLAAEAGGDRHHEDEGEGVEHV